MKIIVPAKSGSERVINKNWRPFYSDESLVDITIKKLKRAGVRKSSIFVTGDDTRLLASVRAEHKVETIFRSPVYCDNDMPIVNVVSHFYDKLGKPAEFAIAMVTCPTFNKYRDCLDAWALNRPSYDSLAVTFEADKFLMMKADNSFAPIGWSFGNCHQISQSLRSFYRFPFAFSILTKKSISETSFFVGRNPYWFIESESHIDIDTERDFYDAAAIYADRIQRLKSKRSSKSRMTKPDKIR
jgi:CMP-N-acetylneuraminic acid synthetase